MIEAETKAKVEAKNGVTVEAKIGVTVEAKIGAAVETTAEATVVAKNMDVGKLISASVARRIDVKVVELCDYSRL